MTEADELEDIMISGNNRVNEQMNLQGSEHGIGEACNSGSMFLTFHRWYRRYLTYQLGERALLNNMF